MIGKNYSSYLHSIGILVLVVFIFSPHVKADDATTVNITGRVTASACTVDASSINQTVPFGKVAITSFPSIGSSGAWKDFSLNLSSCPLSTTKVIGTFSGNADSNDVNKYANTGTSKGIALQMSSRDHQTDLGPNSSLTINVNSTDQTAIFPLSARLIRTGDAGSGSFQSQALVTFSYE
ncbi:fimbrial protein [Serratia ureilytica]|uniref:fimbrial protein n=1 Tax=Serratia TaxID=613 RepID=UPI00313EB379|nr:fimbrial protein [Serratia marcescens]